MNTTKPSQEEIDDFVKKDVLDILGLSNLPEDKKNELREKIVSTIQNRVFRRITKELEAKGKLKDFKSASDDTIEDFFKTSGIDTDKIFVEEALAFKAQLKASANMVDLGLKPNKTNK